MIIKNIYLLLLFLFGATSIYSQNTLKVNEFLANNFNVIHDEYGEYDDWIEIYNPSENPIDIGGYILTDDINFTNMSRISTDFEDSTTIPPKGFLIIWADNQPEQGPLHVGFKLSSLGEQIYLINGTNNTIVDSVTFSEQHRNISLGRYQNNWMFYDSPTPLEENAAGFLGISSPPSFSEESSVFIGSKTISIIKNNPNDTIRYTLDGSNPTLLSQIYNNSIEIDSTTIIRASTFESNYIPSRIISNTFVLVQESNLPKMIIVTDPPNLWNNSTGIYVKYNGRGREWERESVFQYIKNNSFQFSINSGLRIQGSTSRKLPKKSFRLFFREDYGEDRLTYDMFLNSDVNSFKNLVLRGGYDEDLTQPKGTLLRDPLVSELWKSMGELTSLGNFATLHLNNDYWGIYNIRESINEDFVRDHLQYENFDLIRYTKDDPVYFPELDYGSMEDWDELTKFFNENDFTQNSVYEEAKQRIDINNYTNLQVLAQCTQYFSWGYGVFVTKEKNPNAKWYWTIWDMDRAYTTYTWNEFSRYNSPNSYWYYLILNRLLQNENYRVYFINRMNDMLNTLFLPENVTPIIDSLANIIRPEIPNEAARWNSTVEKWETNFAGLKEFADKRPDIVRTQMNNFFNLPGEHNLSINVSHDSCSIKVNSLTIKEFPWTGKYSDGIPITIESVSPKGYRFVGWSDSTLQKTNKIEISLSNETIITAIFEKIIEGDHYEIIAPKIMMKGEFLPTIVRLKSDDENILSYISKTVTLSNNSELQDSLIKIKKGTGAFGSIIKGTTSFNIIADDVAYKSENKSIVVSDSLPQIIYSNQLPSGIVKWNSDFDRHIQSDLTIPENTKLIIEEGTRVLLGTKVNVFVYGELIVNGTRNNPVLFMPIDNEQPWGGFEFFNTISSMSYCFWINGGGDQTKAWKHSAEFGIQPILFAKEDSELNFDNVFILFSPNGKAIAADNSKINVDNCVISNVFHGGEFWYSLIDYKNSYIMNIPNDDGIFVRDEDNDGMHIDYEYPGEEKLSKIDNCYFISGKDDAIDQQNAYLQISNTWLEDWIHEGVATSNEGSPISERNTVYLFNVVVKGCDNGFESGHGSPKLFIDHCVAIENKNGIRFGDSYSKPSLGHITISNTILYNNDDNIYNYDPQLGGPTENAIDISFSMTNDSTYDNNPYCITGIPSFGDNLFIDPKSPGSGMGMNGTNIGLINSSILQTGPIIINEIMYDASINFNTQDWIELYNPQSVEQNLSNWVLRDNNNEHSFILPSNIKIGAQGYLVLTRDSATFNNLVQDSIQIIGDFNFSFGERDEVRLYSSTGQLVDSLAYEVQSPWPVSPNGNGPSLELKDFRKDNTLAENWGASKLIGGSPGYPNSFPVNITKSVNTNPRTFSLKQNYPNPFNNTTVIEYVLPEKSKVSIKVYNILGQLVLTLFENKIDIPGIHKVNFNASGLSSGVYLYRLIAETEHNEIKSLTKKVLYLK